MYKRYCLNPPGYLVQPLLCFIEGVSLPLEARKEFVAERNLLTWLNPNNSTEIIALWGRGVSKITKKRADVLYGWPQCNDGRFSSIFMMLITAYNTRQAPFYKEIE